MCSKNKINIKGEFKCCFKNVFKSEDEINNVQCPNQIVAIVSIEKGKITFNENYIRKDKRESDEFKSFFHDVKSFKYNNEYIERTIVIILESPYKSEYKIVGNKKVPIGPACGTTGGNISKYLLSNLMKYRWFDDKLSNGCFVKNSNEISEGLYKLFLVNAVPFQCLIEGNENNKNKLLLECLKTSTFKEYLVNEIKSVNPTIIINCSTDGTHKELIDELLTKEFPNKILLKGYHPSSAYFPSGFKKI